MKWSSLQKLGLNLLEIFFVGLAPSVNKKRLNFSSSLILQQNKLECVLCQYYDQIFRVRLELIPVEHLRVPHHDSRVLT